MAQMVKEMFEAIKNGNGNNKPPLFNCVHTFIIAPNDAVIARRVKCRPVQSATFSHRHLSEEDDHQRQVAIIGHINAEQRIRSRFDVITSHGETGSQRFERRFSRVWRVVSHIYDVYERWAGDLAFVVERYARAMILLGFGGFITMAGQSRVLLKKFCQNPFKNPHQNPFKKFRQNRYHKKARINRIYRIYRGLDTRRFNLLDLLDVFTRLCGKTLQICKIRGKTLQNSRESRNRRERRIAVESTRRFRGFSRNRRVNVERDGSTRGFARCSRSNVENVESIGSSEQTSRKASRGRENAERLESAVDYSRNSESAGANVAFYAATRETRQNSRSRETKGIKPTFAQKLARISRKTRNRGERRVAGRFARETFDDLENRRLNVESASFARSTRENSRNARAFAATSLIARVPPVTRGNEWFARSSKINGNKCR